MAVNTSNSAGFSALNLYKMNLEANKDVASDMLSSGKPTGNDAYCIHISEQAQQLAQAAKNRSGEDLTMSAEQENNRTVIGSLAGPAMQNMAGSTYQAEQNRAILQYAVALVA